MIFLTRLSVHSPTEFPGEGGISRRATLEIGKARCSLILNTSSSRSLGGTREIGGAISACDRRRGVIRRRDEDRLTRRDREYAPDRGRSLNRLIQVDLLRSLPGADRTASDRPTTLNTDR